MAKKHWYDREDIDEASVVAGVKGFQMPIGAQGKKKMKNNPSKPYGEDELSEAVAEELDREIEERIEKQGDQWVVIDPRTGATHGGSSSRDQARALQKQLGITVPRDKSQGSGYQAGEKKTTVKQRKPPKTARVEGLKKFFQNTLSELGLKIVKESNSMISYMFDEAVIPEINLWEAAVKKLPREVVMSDNGLKEILESIALAEAKTLARSVAEIKKVLESSGKFMVERDKADEDPDTGDIRMPFKVKMGSPEGGSSGHLLFGVRLEGGKPIILFPKESREALNSMVTAESKLLRAELMHIQETVLDLYEDVIQERTRRDTYLNEMHRRLHESIREFNLVEAVILKNLVREKLKGAKRK